MKTQIGELNCTGKGHKEIGFPSILLREEIKNETHEALRTEAGKNSMVGILWMDEENSG